ncbi:MAG TPA: DUF3500 domain-containing protein [Dehalococcoidia bacterium]|nr:DUF3500 domain-containing protein [Dehalococcoidia bacterium]
MAQVATADIATLIGEMTRAAAGFLDSLQDAQRDKATVPFEDEETRRRWYYTPTPRHGLPLRETTAEQYQWLRRLMAAGLSEAGYNYAAIVLALEWAVDYHSSFPDRTYGDLPNTRVRDPGNYSVAVFGTPGHASGWGWTIGGHHLSLHYTLRNGGISPTPAFFGAEPARLVMPGGKTLRALAAEEDFARDLLGQLDPDQRNRAVISDIAATDIVQRNLPRVEDGALYTVGGTGPGGQGLRDKLGLTPEHDERLRYSASTPKGLGAREMTAVQRETLANLVRGYLSHMPDAIARQYESLVSPERLDGAFFAWAGSAGYAEPHYYRIQGQRLLIEYDCTQNDANHTHSVWRDPDGDFGDDLLASHYTASRH